MTEAIKYRLTGAIILVALMVIFLPILFDGQGYQALQKINYSSPNDNTAPIVFDQHFPELDEEVIVHKGIPTSPYSKPFVKPTEDKPLDNEKESMSSEPAKLPSSESKMNQEWIVQAGNFTRVANATVLQNKLKEKGFSKIHQKQIKHADELNYSVRLGPFDKSKADEIAAQLLQKMSIKGLIKRDQE